MKKKKPASPEWKKAFADRREAFIKLLQDAVAGKQVVSRVYDAETGYHPFSWRDEQGEHHECDTGTLSEAVAWLRNLIDHGHKVAFAVSHEETSIVLVAYDGDDPKWSPVWPKGFRLDEMQTSVPFTDTW